ncbi:MAG: VTT domain-containing protein [Bryobacterales bacterium]
MASVFRWVLLSALALAMILVPFFLYEDAGTAWAQSFASGERGPTVAAAAIGGLLAADIVLPVPSSLVATASGYLLGLGLGAAVTWAGMTAGALLGYALGCRPARSFTRRFVGEDELQRAAEAHRRWGDWAIIVCRSVPVLAELLWCSPGWRACRWGASCC